jgi:Transposase DDE domain group 1
MRSAKRSPRPCGRPKRARTPPLITSPVIEHALLQIPAEQIENTEILVRTDSAGATHGLLDFCREHRLRFSVGYELTDSVRAAILEIPEDAWVAALASDGSERENGQIAEITDLLDLTAWPTASRVIVRRERAHPGAQLSFTDHDGDRFHVVLTDQPDPDVPALKRRQRQRAHAETQIPNDKDTSLRNMPF